MRLIWVGAFAATWAMAQSTQGIIAGRITDLRTGTAIGDAVITCERAGTGVRASANTDQSGYYALAPLSPGTYVVRAAAGLYQPREIHEVELAVAGRLELNVALVKESEPFASRTLPIAGGRYVIHFFGPDAVSMTVPVANPDEEKSLLDASRSQVIDPIQIRDLPFFGRDVYTMLVMQPGVSSDGATERGLGYAAGGQRPTAANFMLDGVSANQNFLSGPLMVVPPEAVMEYRISTGDFSAEFGSSAGYLANAVTSAGTDQWRGLAWADVKNEAFNANDFQDNLQGLRRPAMREYHAGYQAGGPLLRNRYFLSSALEYYRSASHNGPEKILLPSSNFLSATAPGSLARALLTEFPAPPANGGTSIAASYTIAPPVTIDRWFGSERFDGQTSNGKHRFSARAAAESDAEPDFIWSPYPAFISGLQQPAVNFAGNLTSSWRPGGSNEFLVGITSDAIEWQRSHPEIPTLVSTGDGAILPGSLAFYGFRNREHGLELSDEVFRTFGRHIVRLGVSADVRGIGGSLTAGQDGRYSFQTLVNFSIDQPYEFAITVNRLQLPDLQLPGFNRTYREFEAAAFFQDTFRVTPRLTLNLGLRYEYYSAPVNTGAQKDAQVELGSGDGFPAMLAHAALVLPKGQDTPYSAPPANLAPRIAFSRDLSHDGRTVLRGGWGMFYDRPFDNIWENIRNNNLALATFSYQSGVGGYLAPIPQVLSRYEGQPLDTGFPGLTMFQHNWKTGYALTGFLAVQHEINESWAIELTGINGLDRHLLTTDEINRPFSIPAASAEPDNYTLSYNPNLPQIAYLGSQGATSYNALTAVARYHANGRVFYAAYTWSHAIDNQSDPLAGSFFDLNFASLLPTSPPIPVGTFSQQFDSRSDKGNSDFDQRQSLVFYSILPLPQLRRAKWILSGWQFSQMAAFRSGFPFSVYAPTSSPASGGTIYNARADIMPGTSPVIRTPAAGGFQVLNPAAFIAPAPGEVGSTGRNAFAGPGFFNIDVSLSRSFPISALSEHAQVTLRADAFNFLNHANLGQPDSQLASATFGQALFGRIGQNTGFPTLIPFSETARQVQLLLRLEF